eukprot:697502_1
MVAALGDVRLDVTNIVVGLIHCLFIISFSCILLAASVFVFAVLVSFFVPNDGPFESACVPIMFVSHVHSPFFHRILMMGCGNGHCHGSGFVVLLAECEYLMDGCTTVPLEWLRRLVLVLLQWI